jgi:hypothetical protein
MNPEWFGDSFDIVKRYFVGALKEVGFTVYVDPMFTGDGESIEEQFLAFLGAQRHKGEKASGAKTALLLDPDTGVGKRGTTKHVTLGDIKKALKNYSVVFSFDQSFSRHRKIGEQMAGKLRDLSGMGIHAFYYDSHARFLFAALNKPDLETVISALCSSGLPQRRIVRLENT